MRGKLFEFWARAESGPMMSEREFELERYWPKLNAITKKYGIVYERENVVPQNVEVLDNIFKAAKELLLEVGIYCTDTERIIEFEESEIDEMLRTYPTETTIGEGKDAITIRHREPFGKEKYRPHCLGRVLGPQRPEILDRVFLSYAKEPRIDHVHFQGVIPYIYGQKIRAGTPFEMAAEITRVTVKNQICRRVGRPGLHDGASTPVTLQGALVGYDDRWGMKKGDARHVYIMPHLKTSYEQMSRAFAAHEYGGNLWGLTQAFVGGLSGGPATSAVNSCAEFFAYCLLYAPTYLGLWPADAMYFSTTSRGALFATFYSGAAFTRNTRIFAPTGAPWGIHVAGPCTEEYFYEAAAGAIGDVICGLNVSGGTGWQSGKVCGATGIGARFASEVGEAATGMDPAEANRLVNYCLSKYEGRLKERRLHEGGKPFYECYDIECFWHNGSAENGSQKCIVWKP